MTATEHLFIFIMAGGSGERFWPLSRKEKPKQLLNLFSDETLLGQAVRRVQDLAPPERVFILTNHAQAGPIQKALPDFPVAQIIGEPAKRDTAPATALATGLARALDPDAVVALLPADQLIKNEPAFRSVLGDTAAFALKSDSLFTIAIPPTYPSTGFGYLELAENLPAEGPTLFNRVSRFKEKPDLDTAQGYLEAGNYSWNAGIFVWKASSYLAVTRLHQPELASFIEQFPATGIPAYLEKAFPSLPKISVDYAIMEKASSVVAARATFDWDDVGSWTALPSHLPSDDNGNTSKGSVVLQESSNNILFSSGRTIALCGVNDLVVVETPDAVLVCHRSQVEDIKKLLPELPAGLL